MRGRLQRNRESGKRALVFVAVIGVILAVASPVSADSPTDSMQAYTDQILKILQEAMLQEKDTLAAIRVAVRKAAIEMFGLAEAAAEVLGPHWDLRTVAEQQEFVQLFADLLEATYISQMDSNGGVKVRYVDESIHGDRADVRAKLITKKGDEMALEATLLHRNGRWFIYDVTIEKISLISNYRAQFERIIGKFSYEELVRRVKAKRDELLSKSRAGKG